MASPAKKSSRAAAKAATPSRTQPESSEQASNLLEEMKQQHREVEALLTDPQAGEELGTLVEQLANTWIPHTLIEEQIILPAIKQGGADEPALAEAEIRRDLVKVLLADLQQDPSGPDAVVKFAVLGSEIEQLIEVEERPETGVLALAESHSIDLEALRPQVDARKSEIQSNTEEESLYALAPTSLRLRRAGAEHREEYSNMPYESNVRDRDERGRFESDDDRRGGYRSRSGRDYDDDYRRSGSNGGGPGRDENGRFTSGGSRSMSSRYEDDDRRGSYRSGANDRDRDEYGRFTSDDDRGYSSRSSRYEDDDRRGNGGGRGHGGWFGDPQGHSEASREGWEDRRGGGSMSRSSRYEDDDRRGGGRGEGRGWYGDSRGHSEAAREGWEERRGGNYSRSSRDDDDDRRGSRSMRDDDDDRRGGGRSHGGWFGDSQGHSEAARRGWDDRR